MDKNLPKKIVDRVAQALSQFKFNERRDAVTSDIVAVVKKPSNLLRILFRGLGICAVVVVPESVTDRMGLKAFIDDVRRDISSRFVRIAAYRNTYLFIVLVCRHDLFAACPGVAAALIDKTGLHTTLIQGVILVDSATREVTGDYTWIPQHKREFEALLSATSRAVK